MGQDEPSPLSPLDAIHLAQHVRWLPDGRSINTLHTRGYKALLVAIGSHYPYCWPSQARLALDCGAHRSTVNRWLGNLEAWRMVFRFQRTGASTTYTLNVGLLRKLSAEGPPGVSHLARHEEQVERPDNDGSYVVDVDDWEVF